MDYYCPVKYDLCIVDHVAFKLPPVKGQRLLAMELSGFGFQIHGHSFAFFSIVYLVSKLQEYERHTEKI